MAYLATKLLGFKTSQQKMQADTPEALVPEAT